MIFQFAGGTVGGQLQQILRILEQWGFVDAFLPFLLIFVLLFAILNRVKLFQTSSNKADRRLNGLISFAISLMVVIPHVLGRYPRNMDPVILINTLLPSAAVLIVAILLLMLLLGLTQENLPSVASAWIGYLGIIILGIVIASVIWPTWTQGTFLSDPTLQALVIILLVMGLVVWFVTRTEGEETEYEESFLEYLAQKPSHVRKRKKRSSGGSGGGSS